MFRREETRERVYDGVRPGGISDEADNQDKPDKPTRVYQIAQDLGLAQKDLVAKVRALGLAINNHMSLLSPEDVVRVRRHVEKERHAGLEEKQLSPTVSRRRARVEVAPPPVEPPTPIPPAPRAVLFSPIPPAAPKTAEIAASPARPEASTASTQPPFATPAATHAVPLPIPAALARVDVISSTVPRVEITEIDRGRRDMPRRNLISERDRLKAQQKFKRKRVLPPGKKGKQTEITTPAEHKRVVHMADAIAVSELAHRMGVKATELLKKLWSMGMTGININQNIDSDTASLVATDFGYEVMSEMFREEQVLGEEATDRPEDMTPRPPIVTIMGHVDHGKTSLLDAIRQTHVVDGEAGGITQHIGAYRVSTPSGDVVFIDTPGHEAFTAMRARGAQVTDIVVLVVAADDGPMPQTLEAIEHARAAEVPIVVAMNKIDKPEANPERVRNQLAEKGLVPEQWGGDTIYVEVSARTKQGVEKLLENLAAQAEIMDLRANSNKPARGTVLEARLDRARGPMATVIVEEGTLKAGDIIVTGEHIGKVRAMIDDRTRPLASAGPATPFELLGLGGVPEAGDALYVVADERAGKELIEHRRDQRRQKELGGVARVSMESLMERMAEGQVKELRVVLKADVQGSAEAMRQALERIGSDQVRVAVLSAAVGGINETDVNLAKASGAIIVGFHVRPTGKVAQLAEQEAVQIKLYDIIYEALDDVRKAAAGLLPSERREKILGRADVLQIFHITKAGTIAGCRIADGKVTRSASVRLIRDSVKVHEGRLASLKRFKDDVREVEKGYECGLAIEGYNDLKPGDVVEAFEIEEIAATL